MPLVLLRLATTPSARRGSEIGVKATLLINVEALNIHAQSLARLDEIVISTNRMLLSFLLTSNDAKQISYAYFVR